MVGSSMIKKPSGADAIAMIATLEAFVIALAASEMRSRGPDRGAFLDDLVKKAVDAADRYGHLQASEFSRLYAKDLVDAIKAEAEE